MNIFSRLKKGKKHVTLHYSPGNPQLYPGMLPDEEIPVWKIGEYSDDEVACDIVKILVNETEKFTQVDTDRVLHITTKCNTGLSPVLSGIRATKGYKEIPAEYLGLFKVGFFKTKEDNRKKEQDKKEQDKKEQNKKEQNKKEPEDKGENHG